MFPGQWCVRETTAASWMAKTREALRLRAMDEIEAGVHTENAAASLGMARGTVYVGVRVLLGSIITNAMWLADPVRRRISGPGGAAECPRHGDPHCPSRERDTVPRSPDQGFQAWKSLQIRGGSRCAESNRTGIESKRLTALRTKRIGLH
jgi:hypothetical protein